MGINKQQISTEVSQWLLGCAGTGLVRARAGGKSSHRDLAGRRPAL